MIQKPKRASMEESAKVVSGVAVSTRASKLNQRKANVAKRRMVGNAALRRPVVLGLI